MNSRTILLIKAPRFFDMLSAIIYCMDRIVKRIYNQTCYTYKGFYISIYEGNSRLFATDGHVAVALFLPSTMFTTIKDISKPGTIIEGRYQLENLGKKKITFVLDQEGEEITYPTKLCNMFYKEAIDSNTNQINDPIKPQPLADSYCTYLMYLISYLGAHKIVVHPDMLAPFIGGSKQFTVKTFLHGEDPQRNPVLCEIPLMYGCECHIILSVCKAPFVPTTQGKETNETTKTKI